MIMRKTIIGFLTFYFTLFIGLSVYNVWYSPAHNSVQEVPLTVVNNSVESVQNKAEDEYDAVEPYKIASCINPNAFIVGIFREAICLKEFGLIQEAIL